MYDIIAVLGIRDRDILEIIEASTAAVVQQTPESWSTKIGCSVPFLHFPRLRGGHMVLFELVDFDGRYERRDSGLAVIPEGQWLC